MVFGFFTPYVEAPSVPSRSPAATDSGSNTADIDHLRQGVEISTDAQRYAGVLPILGDGDSQHRMELTVFGQSSEFTVDTKFGDVPRFDPVAYLNSSRSVMFPVVLDNPSYEDPERLGGYIQPLAIAARDLLTTTAEFEPHDIRAQLMDGDESSFKSVCRITRFYDPQEPVQTDDAYVDILTNVGSLTSSLMMDGIFPVFETDIRPFDETKYLSRTHRSGSLSAGTSDIIVKLVSMSNGDSEFNVPINHRSLGTGFTYGDAAIGFDSIAFGGLKRS